jgi:hypothetical protein
MSTPLRLPMSFFHRSLASDSPVIRPARFRRPRIFPSGWRSMTIVVLSAVAKRSRISRERIIADGGEMIDVIRDHAKIIIDFLTLVLAILAFFRAMYVYRQQKHRDHELTEASDRLKRFEKFQDMQKRFREDESIKRVLRFLYPNQYPDQQVQVSEGDKFVFMGFFEEIAIMINSGLISRDLAYWTIGLDAANFYNTDQTYRNDRTGTLFNSFAQKVRARFPEISLEEIAELKF